MRSRTPLRKSFAAMPFLLAVFVLAAAPPTRLRAAGSNTPLFLPAVGYDSGGYDASLVAVADVNGDGKSDIIVANVCGNSSSCSAYVFGFDGTVAVLLGNGDGTFQPAVTYASGG